MPPRIAQARARWADRDRRWALILHGLASRPAVVATLVLASRLGDGLVWYATMLVLPFVGGPRGTACALQMLGVGVLNLALYRTVKRRVCRPRPCDACPGIRACTPALDEYSFPSGHTLHAVAFSLVIQFHYPAAGMLVWPFTLLVAASRIVLGLHYPSDVALGAAMGALMGAASALLVLMVN